VLSDKRVLSFEFLVLILPHSPPEGLQNHKSSASGCPSLDGGSNGVEQHDKDMKLF